MEQLDTDGIIVNKQFEGFGEPNSKCIVTPASYNGYAWECYVCRREFNTPGALSQHVNSPVHAQKAYHCPNRALCTKQFATLASLFNHLESETCNYMRFEEVQEVRQRVKDAIFNNKPITMC
ncbi:zinc finger protein [Penicillium angulare]|uniref:zinc finger protein n=1 Tax=Penicillium angulare TaxID=116970 RepID=UPI002540EEEF|nr:zinc finger protein [Penicillium angulare]KAJ5259520.1 zinc finger protein [Penicillium angulare]